MYKAIFFHPDGDFVTDFKNSNSIDDAWEHVENMGSRWIFYPIVFVCTDKTIVDVPKGLEHLNGKRIKTVQNHIVKQWKQNPDKVCQKLNNGVPLQFIY